MQTNRAPRVRAGDRRRPLRRGDVIRLGLGVVGSAALIVSCTTGTRSSPSTTDATAVGSRASGGVGSSGAGSGSAGSSSAGSGSASRGSASSSAAMASGEFTFSFAGDVNFSGRTATRLSEDPSTIFGAAEPVISAADLSMVNLETAITDGGSAAGKEFTFRAPPAALSALHDAGVDVATMANNHGADYGAAGVRDSLAAIAAGPLPVVGIGATATAAFAPWVTTVRGTKIAVIAASQVKDETLANYSASATTPGIANAYSPALVAAVKAAKADGDLVIVYVHWGTEYQKCPNADQQSLATTLDQAGATAIIGTHAHLLQGAGWRSDGTYVAYGLGNYLWWRSLGSASDDNGVLTLTFRDGKVVSDVFAPAHLDSTGVPVPATGAAADRINAAWSAARACTTLSSSAP